MSPSTKFQATSIDIRTKEDLLNHVVEYEPTGSSFMGRVNSIRVGRGMPKLTVFSPPQSSSTLRDFTHCERYFFWAHRLGLKTRTWSVAESPALFIGSIFHEIVEDCVVHGKKKTNPTEILDRARVRFMDRLTTEEEKDEELSPKLWSDFYKAVAMAIAYTSKYPVIHKDHVLNQTEIIYLIKDYSKLGLGNPLIGKVDMVTSHQKNLYFYDHKTTGDKPESITQVIGWDLQPYFYRMLIEATNQQRVKASFHNVVQKTGIKYCPDGADKEGIVSYFERVQKWYVDKEIAAKSTPKDTPMARHTIFFSSSYPVDFIKWLKKCDRALRRQPNLDAFPKTPNMYNCLKFNKVCQFAPLCSVDQSTGAVAEVIEERYVQINPLKRYVDSWVEKD